MKNINGRERHMKKRYALKRSLLLVLSVLLIITVFPIQAGAATKRKKFSSYTNYSADGKKLMQRKFKYDKKGNLSSLTTKMYNNGKLARSVTDSRKYTFWKNSKVIKKAVLTDDEGTYIHTYNRNGILLSSRFEMKSGDTSTKTGTIKGNAVYYETRDKDGKLIDKSKQDKNGYVLSYTGYNGDGDVSYSYTQKITMKKGVLRKIVKKASDGSKEVTTFDKYGNETKCVYTGSNGKTETTITKNTYKKGYLTKARVFKGKKLLSYTVYKYTKKAY